MVPFATAGGEGHCAFRDQVPGVVKCYQRRTDCLADQLGSAVEELEGRPGARLSRAISRSTELRMLMRRAAPPLRVPRVLGIDGIAPKRRHRYATAIIDAETGPRPGSSGLPRS
ncbi:hypothetical protein ACFZDB_33880 [Streptomyces luteogriseus]|uniref:hypothetical protein n=2 Tax=Streptomyces TaxID=1883 RepID=UPI0036E90920